MNSTPTLLVITLSCLFFSCSRSEKNGIEIIKLTRVERLPNSLEYSKKPFTKDELSIAESLLKQRGKNFFIDSSRQLFLPVNQFYGENIKTYMWVLSDDISDSLQTKGK